MRASKPRIAEVVGLGTSLIGSGVLYLWPDKSWLGWIVIALGGVVLFTGAVWEIARHFAFKDVARQSGTQSPAASHHLTQTAPIHFAPVISPSFNQSQSQEQQQIQQPTSDASVV